MTQQEEETNLEDRLAELESQLQVARQQHREMRSTVVTVARKYAQQHGLCEVVDKALDEAGLGPTLETVEMKITAPINLSLQVDATALEGMSEEEKKKHVASQIKAGLVVQLHDHLIAGDLVPRPIGVGARPRPLQNRITIGDFELEGFGVIETPERPADEWNSPPGWQAKYSSNNARVLHYFPLANDGRGYASSMCSKIPYARIQHLLDYSSRGQNRICDQCARYARTYR